MSLLHAPFQAACARLPNKLALVCGDQRLTYADLAAQVEALAHQLSDQGVLPGDRVVIFLDTSVEYVVALHAVLTLGAVMVPVSALLRTEKLAYVLADTQAVALLTQVRLAPVWQPALANAADLRCVVVQGEQPVEGVRADSSGCAVAAWPAAGSSARSLTAAARRDDDLAAILYTSGTTGWPKGVMLTHRNMRSAWDMVQQYLGLREDDVVGLALAPTFSYGLYYVLMSLGLGATMVLMRFASFPVKVLQALAAERVTVFPGVPTLFASLIGSSLLDEQPLPALRLVTNAAAALPVPHLQRLRAAWPSMQLYSMYGMTECKRISYLPPDELLQRPDSVGRGLSGQEHWLEDAAGNRLPPGSTGELVVSGPHVMQGYWRKLDETRQRLPSPGVMRTGDIFRTDADGWLYFVARSDDIIKSRGEKVSPREVENAIHALPGVAQCAVIGVDDALLGQAIKAFVVTVPGATLTERDVIKHCQAHLESYMAPKAVVFVDDLPRTDSGKVRKLDLSGV